jgi:hypothetical protein
MTMREEDRKKQRRREDKTYALQVWVGNARADRVSDRWVQRAAVVIQQNEASVLEGETVSFAINDIEKVVEDQHIHHVR